MFTKLLLQVSPVLKFTIKESSMTPSVNPGDTVFVARFSYLLTSPKKRDLIILLNKKGEYLLKRISNVEQDKVFVLGDNSTKSIDSRHFGWVGRKEIIGRVFYVKFQNHSQR